MSGHRRVNRDAGPPAATRPKPGPPTQPLRQIPAAEAEAAASSSEPGQLRAPRRRRRRRGRGGSRLPERAIVFVGPMAAGKTSLGKRVARELGIEFVDTDAVFVRKHGVIAEFFERHGEAEFRRLEAEVIAEELAVPGPRIVALGGGAVIAEQTRRLLREHPVVLLMTTQEAVLRTANIARRPLLRDDPEAWGRILEERRGFYEEVADVTYRTDRATKEQLARRVAQWARGYERQRRRADGARRHRDAAHEPSEGE
ncbi:shikimate kinase [Leucobacter massiliensis]|uniref:Shikimate kinase n=1 Tax=Leucobacter massiliensis TaxID=1686285 RepID=A0A2S9QRK3_9MICO|nr:shikimate kinase [Leucobacter massiliensis]PRI12219.1 shikimate kinase [Leucobacter massiliensis]